MEFAKRENCHGPLQKTACCFAWDDDKDNSKCTTSRKLVDFIKTSALQIYLPSRSCLGSTATQLKAENANHAHVRLQSTCTILAG